MVSGGKIHLASTHCFTKASTSGYLQLIRNLAALISLAVFFSGSFALSTQSVEAKTSETKTSEAKTSEANILRNSSREAKTSRNSTRIARNYFVPPPPPYAPSLVPSALGMTNAQVVTADADYAVMEKLITPYSKYIFTRNQGKMPQVVQPNPYVSYNRGVETKILKHIDSIDSEISSHEKEIGKLLNL
jgi:hypothetical protein